MKTPFVCPLDRVTANDPGPLPLGPLPPVHPREALVAAAARKLETALDEALKGLTTAEALRAVTAAFSGWLAFVANVGIRRERSEPAAGHCQSGAPAEDGRRGEANRANR